MSKEKCSSEHPESCRYHGHEATVARVEEQRREAEKKMDFDGIFKATGLLKALSRKKKAKDGSAALDAARDSGDFGAFYGLTEGSAGGSAQSGENSLQGTNGQLYRPSSDSDIASGASAPDRIWTIDFEGRRLPYVTSDHYTRSAYPYNLRVQASRPLNDEEMFRIAKLTGEQYRKGLGGTGRTELEMSDGTAAVMLNNEVGGEVTDQNRDVATFETGLKGVLRDGSAAGDVEGFGDDVTFTFYYEDRGVKLPQEDRIF